MKIVIKKAYTGNDWSFVPGQRIEVDGVFGAALVAEGYAVSLTASDYKSETSKSLSTVEFAIERAEKDLKQKKT